MSNAFTLADRALNLIRNSPFMGPEEVNKACELADQAAGKAASCKELIQTGMAYLELGKAEKAGEIFSKAVESDKRNPAARLFAALAASDAKKYEEALKHLDELKTLCPDNQAAPTLRALVYLHSGKAEEAFKILEPKKGKFDLTVSLQILSRFAEAAENYLLPRELPDIENDFSAELQVPEGSAAAKDLEKIAPFLISKKGAVRAESAGDNPDEFSKDKSNSSDCGYSSESGINSKENTAMKDKAESFSDHNYDNNNGPAEAEKSLTGSAKKVKGSRLFSILDTEAAAMASKGGKLLKKCWDLPEEERLKQLELAKEALRRAYGKNKRIPQLAYDLGEALLGSVEYGHKAGTPVNADELAALDEAEEAFAEALNENSENAYALHYVGRVALLKRQPVKAEQAWRLALSYFEKLPESEYGLAQVSVLLGDSFRAQRHICRALSSDLQLLRDRLQELKAFI